MTLQKLIDADTRHVGVAASFVLLVLLVLMAVFLYIVRLSRGDVAVSSFNDSPAHSTQLAASGAPTATVGVVAVDGRAPNEVGSPASVPLPTHPIEGAGITEYDDVQLGFRFLLLDSWRNLDVDATDGNETDATSGTEPATLGAGDRETGGREAGDTDAGSSVAGDTDASDTDADDTDAGDTDAGASDADASDADDRAARPTDLKADQHVVFEDPSSGARIAVSIWDESPQRSWDAWAPLALPGMSPIGGVWAPTALIAGEPAVVAYAPETPILPALYAVVLDNNGRRFLVSYSASDGGQLIEEYVRAIVTLRLGAPDPTSDDPPDQIPPLPQPASRFFP